MQADLQGGADDDCENDLQGISGQVGDHTDRESRREGNLHLEGQPCRTKGISDGGCERHSDHDKETPVREPFNEDSGQYGHEDEAQQIPAGWPGDLAGTSGESGEYRKSGGAQQQIYKIADCGVFPSEYVDADQKYQIRKRDRNRTDRDRDSEWGKNTGNGSHHGNQDQAVRGQAPGLIRGMVGCRNVFH